jgi:hypothetical protein
MVGNVWQWTNTFTDEHTSAAVVRGGSPYQPQTTLNFYFPSTPVDYALNRHNKYLLMAPSLDRSSGDRLPDGSRRSFKRGTTELKIAAKRPQKAQRTDTAENHTE